MTIGPDFLRIYILIKEVKDDHCIDGPRIEYGSEIFQPDS